MKSGDNLDRNCKPDGFSCLASLTAPILSDSPLTCFEVAINTVKHFCGCVRADIQHLFFDQLISSTGAWPILRS